MFVMENCLEKLLYVPKLQNLSSSTQAWLEWTDTSLCYEKDRVSTASGNQGKLEGIFPVKEKSGNLTFF